MPGGAPQMMQFPTLQYAKSDSGAGSNPIAQQMQGLGKNLASAKAGLNNYLNPTQPPGVAQTGMAGSPYAGPVAPPPAAAAGGQPPMAAPAAGPFPAVPQNPTPQLGVTPFTGQLPTPPQPYPNMGQSPVSQWAQNNPVNMIQWLKNSLGGGGMASGPGQPGAALLNSGGAGMLQPTMNNPMLNYPGGAGG